MITPDFTIGNTAIITLQQVKILPSSHWSSRNLQHLRITSHHNHKTVQLKILQSSHWIKFRANKSMLQSRQGSRGSPSTAIVIKLCHNIRPALGVYKWHFNIPIIINTFLGESIKTYLHCWELLYRKKSLYLPLEVTAPWKLSFVFTWSGGCGENLLR